MKKLLAILLSSLFFAPVCLSADWAGGLYSSPEGFGVSTSWRGSGGDMFYSLESYVDCYDVMYSDAGGRCGVALRFSDNISLKKFSCSSSEAELYAGPGIYAGYVRDRGESLPGPTLAVTGSLGVRFTFRRGVVIDAGLGCALGGHIDRSGSGAVLQFYTRGLSHALLPRLKIEFPLR